jgi:peptidoglycan/xylan/chitin deacetylase (PgdA/CDA1 family)
LSFGEIDGTSHNAVMLSRRRNQVAAAVILVGVVFLVVRWASGSGHHNRHATAPVPTTAQLGGGEPIIAPAQRPTSAAVPAGPRARVQYVVRTNDAVVFVTIDDGFVRDRRVIAFIRAHHWPISAFVIDRLAVRAPSYFRQLMAAGATLNDHTYTHPDLPTRDYATQQNEICHATEDFPRLFGVKPRLFRPPYGAYDDATRRAAEACGFSTLVEWTGTMNNGVLQLAVKGPLRHGDVLLLHFTPTLYSDLQKLAARISAAHLTVARLENYIAT